MPFVAAVEAYTHVFCHAPWGQNTQWHRQHTRTTQQGAFMWLFLFHSSALRQVLSMEKLAQIPLPGASALGYYSKDLQALHPLLRNKTFHYLKQTGERYFQAFHRDIECVFLREVIPVSKAFFSIAGDRNYRLKRFSPLFLTVDVLCSGFEPGMGCLIIYNGTGSLAARVKRHAVSVRRHP